jgi:3-oxoadipate enol-lactonase
MPKIKIRDARIHCQIHGEGQPVLLVPGLASDLSTWKKAVPYLEKQHKVIVFDNRGSGLTEAPGAAFTMETLRDDAIGMLDALEIEKAHIIGWSMGGSVAQEIALGHPERLGALVLMSSFMKEPDRSRVALDAMIQSVREGASPDTFMMMIQTWCSTQVAFEGKNASLCTRTSDDHTEWRTRVIEGFARQKQALDGFDSRNRLKGLSCPTLVVHGSDDIMVPPSFGQDLASRIPGSELFLVKGAGHFLPSSVWVGPVLSFLARHPCRNRSNDGDVASARSISPAHCPATR